MKAVTAADDTRLNHVYIPEYLTGTPFFNVKHYHHVGDPVSTPFSRNDFYKIWLMHGRGSLRYADRRIDIEQPALVFCNPLIPYAYEGYDRERTGYWCIFKEDLLKTSETDKSLQESSLFKIGSELVFFLEPQQVTAVTRLFDQLIREADTHYVHKYEVIRNYVNLLMHEGLKLQSAAVYEYHNAAERITGAFLSLLEKQFPIETPMQVLSLKKAGDYADGLSVHVNHLNYAVREVTGKTTSEHIANRIIIEAKALLVHTGWSIAEIAYSLGFDYPNHFNSFFKKHTRVTPRAMRK